MLSELIGNTGLLSTVKNYLIGLMAALILVCLLSIWSLDASIERLTKANATLSHQVTQANTEITELEGEKLTLKQRHQSELALIQASHDNQSKHQAKTEQKKQTAEAIIDEKPIIKDWAHSELPHDVIGLLNGPRDNLQD